MAKNKAKDSTEKKTPSKKNNGKISSIDESKYKISELPFNNDIVEEPVVAMKKKNKTESNKTIVKQEENNCIKIGSTVTFDNTIIKSEEINNTGFSLNNPIYIEIHKSNMLQYFNSGIIFPYKYSKQKAFDDPQTINSGGIILSNGKLTDYSDQNIIIQVSSDAIDESLLNRFSNYAIYTGLIPISRILKIFVYDSEVKNKLIDDSLLRDGGLIPENLISIGIPKELVKINYEKKNIEYIDLTEKLILYDKILGLLAGTRNYNMLSFNQTSNYKSLSDHFLYATQAIIPDFAKNIIVNPSISEFYKWLFLSTCPQERILLQWIMKRVHNNTNFTDNDTKEFEELCIKSKAFNGEEKQVLYIFSMLRKSLERSKVYNEILKINSKLSLALYIFAYLRNYASFQNPEQARIDLAQVIPSKYDEYAFSALNFFFGYKQLRNFEDRLKLDEINIFNKAKIINKPPIKFDMGSTFDYMIIDSVFKYVFGDCFKIKDNDYSKYLNIVDINNVDDFTISGYNFTSSLIYGKIYTHIIKINPLDELIPILEKLPTDITIFSEFGLYCHRIGLKMSPLSFTELFLNPSSIKRLFSFSKINLIEYLRNNKVDIEELKLRIKLSQKHKEL